MDEIKELAELVSPTGKNILGIMTVLKRTHGELLEIYNDTEREVKALWKKK